MTRFKLALGTILLLLTALIILQNSAPVETKFLFFSLVLPQALLLLLTTLIGFALGVIAVLLSGRKRRPPEPKRSP